MEHDFEMIAVEFAQHLLRIGEYFGVEREGSVPGVPTGRDRIQCPGRSAVAGQLLFSKGLRDTHHLFTAGQSAMRLQVSERPQRRKVRESG